MVKPKLKPLKIPSLTVIKIEITVSIKPIKSVFSTG
jgi:hypothetical protein